MQLLCAGEAFEDLIFHGLERLPELGEEVRTDRFTSTIGGGAVITAVQAARLGMPTHLISALGDNAMARLKKEKVAVTNLRKSHEPHAITAALSTTDDRAFVTFNGVNTKLEGRLAKSLASLLRRSAGEASARRRTHVHLCFYPHDCRYWADLLAKFRKQGITSSWDFGWNEPLTNDRGLADLINALDFVFINSAEALLYTGSATLDESIPRWREQQAITIIKLGQQGAVWLAPDRDLHIKAPRVKVVDTTGAGDAFNAGFLVAWMRGETPAECLKLANKTGAESTKRAGGI
jgi:sugar/nucleoside kinase (ribokinase family)